MPIKISPALKRAYHLNYIASPDTRMKLRVRGQCAWAIKSGKLTRLPCESCGATKSEAHHEDYSKPLEVKWLCRKCHGAAHRKSHCIHGHALTDDNVFTAPGVRQCRTCGRERCQRRYRQQNKQPQL